MSLFNSGLDGFFHSLIPAGLRDRLKTNTAEYVRVRALTAMLVVTTALSFTSNLLIGGMHLLFSPDMLKYDLVPLGILLLLCLQVWLFYKFHNHWISGLAFTNFYFLITAVLVIVSGGYDSHGKAILLTCPMMSFLIGGRQEGIQNSMITILFCLGLFFLHIIEFDLPNMFREENPYMIFSVNWTFSAVIIAASISVYETELQKRGDRRVRQPLQGVSEFSKRLELAVNQLIPRSLRETLDSQSMIYTRVRILSILLVVATTLGLLHTVLLVIIHASFRPDQLKYDWVIFGITLCFGVQTWLFHKFNNFRFSGFLLSYFYFLVVVALVFVSGAYDSPAVILLLISPLIFFMVGGIHSGIISAIWIAVIGVALAYLKHIEFGFIDFFQGLNRSTVFVVAWSLAICSLASCMMTYDSELEKPG